MKPLDAYEVEQRPSGTWVRLGLKGAKPLNVNWGGSTSDRRDNRDPEPIGQEILGRSKK